jgi:hypothetical protein
MSLQTIIDNATSINVGRTKLASSTISRSGRIKTGIQAGNQPFFFNVAMSPASLYVNFRDTLEEIDRLDAIFSANINIGSTNAGLSWITQYQGDLSSAQLGQITASTTFAGNTIELGVGSVTGGSSTDVVFKAGDYFTFDSGYKYPYTVVSDVTLGTGSTISVTLNRPIITQSGYTIDNSKGILVGTDVTWQVKMLTKPSYTITPDRFVEFNGEFELIEVVED